MSYWNGTRLRTSWLRLRGNASGRRRPYWAVPFTCAGCQKQHGPYVERTEALDGLLYCSRAFEKLLNQRKGN